MIKKRYTVSYCRDTINDKLNNKLSNQQVKQLLIEFYGDNISLMYLKDKSKLQMLFLSSICQIDIVEALRDKNPIAKCAPSLRKKYKNYYFNLHDSNCNPRDVAHSLNQYRNDKLPI